jgi:ABC-type bacteriocin/lantibiotic exporter with double-glycine peptidase domain
MSAAGPPQGANCSLSEGGARSAKGAPLTAALALQLRNVDQRFGATPIIQGLSLDIPCGQRHAIIGP